jgi:rod shape-determining protein MreC
VLALLKRYRELILVAFLLLVPLGVFLANAKNPADRSWLDRAVLTVTSPVERVLAWAVTGVLEAWDGYVALRRARERATGLSREVDALRMERDRLLQERAEAERLRRLLGLAEAAPEADHLGARVIGVRLGPSGRQILTLDRGADQGVGRLMPVVVADGLLGRIHSVTGSTAEVLLLVDTYSSIAVRVERTRARANVRGTGKPGGARLEYALRTEDVIEGDLLVTSGTDGVFPRGLVVGRVTQLRRRPQGLFLEAAVIPAVDPTRVEEVLVLAGPKAADQAPAALGPGGSP